MDSPVSPGYCSIDPENRTHCTLYAPRIEEREREIRFTFSPLLYVRNEEPGMMVSILDTEQSHWSPSILSRRSDEDIL